MHVLKAELLLLSAARRCSTEVRSSSSSIVSTVWSTSCAGLPTLLHADGGDHVEMTLDPGADVVGFLRELSAQSLVVLLTNHLCLERRVAVGHQLPHLRPLVVDVLNTTTTSRQNAAEPTRPMGTLIGTLHCTGMLAC